MGMTTLEKENNRKLNTVIITRGTNYDGEDTYNVMFAYANSTTGSCGKTFYSLKEAAMYVANNLSLKS